MRVSHTIWSKTCVVSLKSALLLFGLLVAQAEASQPEIVAKLAGARAAAAAAAPWRVPDSCRINPVEEGQREGVRTQTEPPAAQATS